MSSSNHYVDPEELEKELTVFSETYKSEVLRLRAEGMEPKLSNKKAKGYISEELGTMFLKIANNLINKNNFNQYTYRDEMIGLGIEYLCRFAKKFDKSKKNCNGFSYCTQICFNGFLQVIEKENKKMELKDAIIKEAMLETEMDKWNKQEMRFNSEGNNNW